MSNEEVARFDWLRASVLGEGGCLTLIESTDAAKVASAFGGSLADAAESSLIEAVQEFGGEPAIALRQAGDWLLVAEVGGEGSRPEVLRRVSAGSRAVSAFWNVNAVTRFSHAVNGQVLTTFEALFPQRREGAEPDGLEDLRRGLPWGSGDSPALMLALAARLTSQIVGPEMLDLPFLVLPVTPWVADIPDSFEPEYDQLTYADPPLGYALRTAPGDTQRRVARVCAHYALAAGGLSEHPLLLRAALLPDRVTAGERAEIDELVRDSRGAGRSGAWTDVWAMEAVREGLRTSPVGAAYRAYADAKLSLDAAGHDPAPLRARVMAELGDPPPPVGSGGLTAPATGTPAQRWAWLADHWLQPAAWVTFVRGHDPAEIARQLGADLSQASTGPVGLARSSTVALRSDGPWVVAVEVGQPMRNQEAALEAASAGTVAVSLMWTLNSNCRFWHAVDGVVATAFDPHTPRRTWGRSPAGLDPVRTGPLRRPTPDAHIAVGLLALAERVTGLALRPEWLDAPHLIAPVPHRPPFVQRPTPTSGAG